MFRLIRRVISWLLVGLVLLAIVLAIPVVYVETACNEPPRDDDYEPIVVDASFDRKEANTYLTYPEWHIVYAYEGMANVLKDGDEHNYNYADSVLGFWKSFCELNRMASRHGAADSSTRTTIHTIGASFTLEMILKAAYEETLGRLFASNRGGQKTPQDENAARVAADYARFLRQVPWYKYDFGSAVDALWQGASHAAGPRLGTAPCARRRMEDEIRLCRCHCQRGGHNHRSGSVAHQVGHYRPFGRAAFIHPRCYDCRES